MHSPSSLFIVGYQEQGQLSVINFSAFTIVSVYSGIPRGGCILRSITNKDNYLSLISVHSPSSLFIVGYQEVVAYYRSITNRDNYLSLISVHSPSSLFIVGYQEVVAY